MEHGDNSFITLTYDEEHLPEDGKVDKREIQLWMKRLRKKIDPIKVRYYAVGEYGEKKDRPHYHVMLFGFRYSLLCSDYSLKFDHYESDEVWQKGNVKVGEVEQGSARYVTNYIIKNLEDENEEKMEFMTSSRKPGIGATAIDKMSGIAKESKYFDRRAISTLNYGKKKSMPLGKYLTDRFSDGIGLSEDEKKKEFYKWQEALLEEYNKEDKYKINLMDAYENARLIQKKRSELWKQKKSI